MLTRLSHMIQLGRLSPSSGPIASWVDNPSPLLKIGAQATVEKRESKSAWRLTIAKILYCFGSPPGLNTRYRSPRLTHAPRRNGSIFGGLVIQDLRSFRIQAVRGGVDAFQIAGMYLPSGAVTEVVAEHLFNKRRT